MQAQTPMLRQYQQHKSEHPEALLAMRVGDFYEFYGPDAETAAAVLGITLTGREDGTNGRVSMAGVPFHSVDKYLARLVQAGHKVALCDQVEDPKAAKGLVRRAVTRVLTPGTILEDSMLSGTANNFLAAICVRDGVAGIATLDPSTGEFLVTEVEGEDWQQQLMHELARIRPSELLVDHEALPVGENASRMLSVAVTEQDSPSNQRAEQTLMDQFQASSLRAYGCEGKPRAVVAASMVLSYANHNQLQLNHIDSLTTYSVRGFMAIDASTRRALELTQNLIDGSRKYTLLGVIDATTTTSGGRLLRRWVDQPLIEIEAIQARQNAIGLLVESSLPRAEVRDHLARLADIERCVARCATGLASPRDLAALGSTLHAVPDVARSLETVGFGRLGTLLQQLGDHRELAMTLTTAIVPDPPMTVREGGVIREGYDVELDKLRSAAREGKSYIAQLESSERARTGISGIKVGYNSVFGYYLEVSKRDSAAVPAEYIRKQTTANAERYITAELKDHESAVLGAQDKAVALESELFQRIRAMVAAQSSGLLQTARALAEIDVLSSLAEIAVRKEFSKPEIVDSDEFSVVNGRHPVVEEHGQAFVPNSLDFGDGMRLMILTGPNMSGKSTYLRQNAQIAILAQMGSFVPAESARIGISDAVFARIGAKDELALGQSTFMVEMLESAYILNHATRRSFVVIDEVGRGTSTYDGMAIAWAMIERLADLGARTLFATHYHQLNVMANENPVIRNYRVSVQEMGDKVIWTHRVLEGGTDRSYGIHVARAAGMPTGVLARATDILREFEGKEPLPTPTTRTTQKVQMSLFEPELPEVFRELRDVDVNTMTPMQALQLLEHWKQQLK